MAGPLVVSVLSVPAIGFLVRFYVALTRDHSLHAHGTAVVRALRPDDVEERMTWRP